LGLVGFPALRFTAAGTAGSSRRWRFGLVRFD
jgi:hypothetical protein